MRIAGLLHFHRSLRDRRPATAQFSPAGGPTVNVMPLPDMVTALMSARALPERPVALALDGASRRF